VQIGLRWCLVDGENGVDNVGGQLLRERAVELCGQRCASDRKEEFAVNLLLKLELVEELRLSASRAQYRKYIVLTLSDSVFARS
jgi:hypothetical protein